MQTNKLDRIGIILCQCLKGAAGNYFVITKSVWDKCMAVPLAAKSVWDLLHTCEVVAAPMIIM